MSGEEAEARAASPGDAGAPAPPPRTPRATPRRPEAQGARLGWVLAPPAGGGSWACDEVRVFGLSPAERLRRSLLRAGCERVEVLPAEAPVPRVASEPAHAGAVTEARHLVFRGDCLFDERLVAALGGAPDALLWGAPEGSLRELPLAANVAAASFAEAVRGLREERAPAGLDRVRAEGLAPAYDAALRKVDPPWVVRPRPQDVRSAEARIFAASYKGLTDLVTKWVWPLPARAATRWCARHAVSPNAVTAVSYVLAALVILLFAKGWLGAGLLAAWWMTFLDTVDGKLARVTLTSSRIGGALDHGLDLVHPPLWWWAFGVGLAASPTPAASPAALAVMTWIAVGGYLLGRALEGVFLAVFRFEIFLWRPFDGVFRTVIARRNPNLLLLTAGVAAGRPVLGFAALAGWTLVGNAVHAVRVGRALARRRRGEPVRPWALEPAPDAPPA